MSGTSTPRRAWNQNEDELVYKFVAEAIWMLNHGYGEEKIPGILPGAIVAGQALQMSSVPRARSSSGKDVSSCCDPEDCGTETDGADSLTPEALPDKKQSETSSRVKTFVDSMSVTRQVRLPNCNTLLDTIDWQALSDKILRHRTPKSIRERWRNHLDPSINHGPWSQEEDEILFRAVQEHGTSWTYISSLLQGRPELQCKNRYYATVRKQRRRQRRVKHAEPTYDSWQTNPAPVAPAPQKVNPLQSVRVEDNRVVTSSSPWYHSGYPAPMPQQYMGGYGFYPSGPAQVPRSAMPGYSQAPVMMPPSLPQQQPQSSQWYLQQQQQQQQQQQVARQYWQPVASQSFSPDAQTCYPGNYMPYGVQGKPLNVPQYQPVHGGPTSCSMKRPAEGYGFVDESQENKMRKRNAIPAQAQVQAARPSGYGFVSDSRENKTMKRNAIPPQAQGQATPLSGDIGFYPRPDGFVQPRVASPSSYHYQKSYSRSEDSLVSDANTLLMLSQTAACR